LIFAALLLVLLSLFFFFIFLLSFFFFLIFHGVCLPNEGYNLQIRGITVWPKKAKRFGGFKERSKTSKMRLVEFEGDEESALKCCQGDW
jgi:hypothetical protein